MRLVCRKSPTPNCWVIIDVISFTQLKPRRMDYSGSPTSPDLGCSAARTFSSVTVKRSDFLGVPGLSEALV